MALDQPDIKGSNGGRAPSPLRDDAGLPREVYSLLAQANLLRMRGCWEEAVTNCMAALRLAPDSPSALSLLGDIYENQGRFDDAIQWYRMALDAHPESPADRLKLGRLLQRQQPLIPTEQQAATDGPGAEDAASDLPAPAPRRRRLLGDPETALRYGALAAAALVCLVVVFAYAAVHRRAALATLGIAGFQEVKATPVVLPPVPDPPAPNPPADAVSTVSTRDSAEQAVLGTLSGSSDLSAQGITVDDVQFDPRAGLISITLRLAAGDGLTRAVLLRSALHTAQAAAAASPSATAFTLRALTAPAAGGGASLVFIGDLSQSALPGAGQAEPDDAHVQALFTNPWWSPQMPG